MQKIRQVTVIDPTEAFNAIRRVFKTTLPPSTQNLEKVRSCCSDLDALMDMARRTALLTMQRYGGIRPLFLFLGHAGIVVPLRLSNIPRAGRRQIALATAMTLLLRDTPEIGAYAAISEVWITSYDGASRQEGVLVRVSLPTGSTLREFLTIRGTANTVVELRDGCPIAECAASASGNLLFQDLFARAAAAGCRPEAATLH